MIYLFREVQNTLASRKRKALRSGDRDVYRGGVLVQMANAHRQEHMHRRILSRFEENRIIGVSYEGFTAEPREELTRLCRFLGLPFSEEVFFDPASPSHFSRQLERGERHTIGGNRVRRSPEKLRRIAPQPRQETLSATERSLFRILGGERLIARPFYRRYYNEARPVDPAADE